MPTLLWDASALVKRYIAETGSSTVNALFAYSPVPAMVATFWGYTETYAILVRKRNAGSLNTPAFTAALSALHNEVVLAGAISLLSIPDDSVMKSVSYILRHNLNSADAAILATYVEYASSLPVGSTPCILIAADQRLLRAAAAEGLKTLNPELLAASDVPGFLAAPI